MGMGANLLEWARRTMKTVSCSKENRVVHLLHGVYALIDRVVLIEGIAAAILDNVVILSADPRVVVTIITAFRSLEARQNFSSCAFVRAFLCRLALSLPSFSFRFGVT
jgi:hypothetical protein